MKCGFLLNFTGEIILSSCAAILYLVLPFREVFSASGVKPEKLVIIPESLDTTLYDPDHTIPLDLDKKYAHSFKFLSVFKWEERKGWSFLLQAYFEVSFEAEKRENPYKNTGILR